MRRRETVGRRMNTMDYGELHTIPKFEKRLNVWVNSISINSSQNNGKNQDDKKKKGRKRKKEGKQKYRGERRGNEMKK